MTSSTSSSERFGAAPSHRSVLLAGGISALLASICCIGPLVLFALGISGAWMQNVMALEPLRPVFLGLAALALLIAGHDMVRPAAADGAPHKPADSPASSKLLFAAVFFLVLFTISLPLAERLTN